MRRWRVVIGCLLSLSAVLIACNDAPQPNPSPDASATPLIIQPTIFATSEPASVATPTVAPTATPVPARPIVIPLNSAIDSLHPFYATSPAARTVAAALFVGCVGIDEQQRPIALGCAQVPTAENGGAVFVGEGTDRFLQATFKIRQGWRWTDGRPVTAQDALYAWQLSMSPESGLRDPVVQQVFSMFAPDERTLVVNFMSAAQAQTAAAGALRGDVPFEYFSQLGDYAQFATQDAPLAPKQYWSVVRWLPAHVLAAVPAGDQVNSDFARKPLGDGAFEIENSDTQRIVLRPSPLPFPLKDATQSGIIGLEFRLGDAANVQINDEPFVSTLVQPTTSVNVSTTRVASSHEQLVLNVDRFPFDDAKVRQAIAHGLKREALGQDPNTTQVSSTALIHDPARAAALLREAGWVCDTKPCQKGFPDDSGNIVTRTLSFKLVTTEREPRNAVSQAIQKQLAELGFAVDVEIVFGLDRQSRMFASYDDGGILLTRNFDAALYQIAASAPMMGQFDCGSVPTVEAHDVSRGNASGFCDEGIDALLARDQNGESVITAAHDQALRDALTRVQQAAPVIPLYDVLVPVQSRGVAGLKPGYALPVTWNVWEWQPETR
jgi:ABC-type transport system substrate-binding protein